MADLDADGQPSALLTGRAHRIERAAHDQNFRIHKIASDGSCLYAAMFHQICGSTEAPHQFRDLLFSKVMEEKPDLFELIVRTDQK